MTSVTWIRKWMGWAIVAGVLGSATLVMAQTGGVTGTAKGTDGKKLAGYPIIISRMDIKSTYKTKTNKKGSYVYIGLPIGDYKVTLEDPSGRALTYVEKHVGMGDPTPVDFDLSKMQGMAQHLEALKEQKQSQALMQAFNQANQLFQQKNYDAAAAAFAKAVPLASGKNVGVVQAHEALAYYQAGQYNKAIPLFQQAIAADPKNQALHGALAQAYVKNGDIKDAETEYKAAGETADIKQLQAAQKAAQSNQQFKNLKGAFDSATQFYNQGQYAQAAASYEKAVPFAKGKNLNVVLQREADSYDKAHQYPQAVAAYQKAMQADPTDANLENSLGSVYAHMGNNQMAMQSFQKAAQMDPPHAARYYFNMGAIMTNAGKMDQAAAAFKKATDLDPTGTPDAYFLEAQALLSKATTGPNGQVNPAPGTVEALQNYLKYAPNGKYAASAQQMLQAITGKVKTTYSKKKGSGS
jgi:tetratricopeptide (TPR) repeat protein